MPTASIKILKGGEPVVGAKVCVGESLKEFLTDENGRIFKTVPQGWGPMCVTMMIQGNDFIWGGGPIHLVADDEVVIEV